MENNLPKITTKETEYLRLQYPSLSHLEAGNIAQWLQERKDQLFEMARASENEADMTRVLGLLASGIGAVCYAVNPMAVVGGLIGGAAWLWFVVEHDSRMAKDPFAPRKWATRSRENITSVLPGISSTA